MRKMLFVGFCLLVCSVAAYAAPQLVPEIDAGSLSTVLALAGGGILILRARSRSR
jgi:hypothetical protein